MKVVYKILSHDVRKQEMETGDWSPQPSSKELMQVLGKTKPSIGLELSTRYFRVQITGISQRQDANVRFNRE